MAEHVHGCLNCKPDMVPDFSVNDPRHHAYEKCGITFRASVNGVDPGYTLGVYEGREGWALFAGADTEAVHDCPNCTTRNAEGFIEKSAVCVTPLFGHVEVVHDCPGARRAG